MGYECGKRIPFPDSVPRALRELRVWVSACGAEAVECTAPESRPLLSGEERSGPAEIKHGAFGEAADLRETGSRDRDPQWRI